MEFQQVEIRFSVHHDPEVGDTRESVSSKTEAVSKLTNYTRKLSRT